MDGLSQLSDVLMWGIGGLIAFLSFPLGILKQTRKRSIDNKRKLEGDDNDPNTEGVLEIAYQTRKQVDSLQDSVDRYRIETKREHDAVMRRLEEIDGD